MAAKKARDIANNQADFLQDVFTQGWEKAVEIWGTTTEEANQILQAGGFNDVQRSVLQNAQELKDLGVIDVEDLPDNLKDIKGKVRETVDRALFHMRNPQSKEQANARFRLQDILHSATTEQAVRSKFGRELVESGGRTEGLDFLQDAAEDVIARGGSTEDLNTIKKAGIALAESGGFTPELRETLRDATSLIQSRGEMTPELREVFNEAIETARGDKTSLLPTDKFVEFAREQAADAIQGRAASQVGEALRRGGGFGARFSGPQGAALAEFADADAREQARATREALTQSQLLRLRERQSALGIAGQAAEAGSREFQARLAAGANLTGSALSAAASNLGSGIQGTIGAESVAAKRLADAQRTSLGVEELSTRRALEGANVLAGLTQENLAAANELSRAEQIRNNMILGSGSLAQAGAQTELGILGFNTGIQQQNFENQLGLNEFLFGAGQAGQENKLRALGIKSGSGQGFLNFAGNALQGANQARLGAAQFQSQPGTFAQFASNFGAGLGEGLGAGVAGGIASGAKSFI